MKRKRLFFGLLLLILLCFVIFYPNSDEHPNPNAPFSNKPTRDQENRSVETPSISFNDLKHTNNEVEISGASRLEREQQLQQRAEANWKMPISFYGKVVDEDGNPISDANVEFVWQALSGTPKVTTTSDEQGLFRLEGKVGKLLGVYLEKEGYYVSRREQNSFDYGSPSAHNFHVADPSSPVVFQLRKRGGGS